MDNKNRLVSTVRGSVHISIGKYCLSNIIRILHNASERSVWDMIDMEIMEPVGRSSSLVTMQSPELIDKIKHKPLANALN